MSNAIAHHQILLPATAANGVAASSKVEPKIFTELLRAIVHKAGGMAALVVSCGQVASEVLASLGVGEGLMRALLSSVKHWRIPTKGASTHLVHIRGMQSVFVVSIPIIVREGEPRVALAILLDSELMSIKSLSDHTVDYLEGFAACIGELQMVSNHSDSPTHLTHMQSGQASVPCCCVCAKMQNSEGRWLDWNSSFARENRHPLSHTYCPECAETAIADLCRE